MLTICRSVLPILMLVCWIAGLAARCLHAGLYFVTVPKLTVLE